MCNDFTCPACDCADLIAETPAAPDETDLVTFRAQLSIVIGGRKFGVAVTHIDTVESITQCQAINDLHVQMGMFALWKTVHERGLITDDDFAAIRASFKDPDALDCDTTLQAYLQPKTAEKETRA